LSTIISCIDIPIVVRETVDVEDKYIIAEAILDLIRKREILIERTAQLTAHRACCGSEHNPQEGKIHGYCVVCGVPWPCSYAGNPLILQDRTEVEG
jgi:hypothetical protein